MPDSLRDPPQPSRSSPPDSGRPAWLIVGLILVLESCAAVTTVLMAGLLVRYASGQPYSLQPLTTQAARMLQYWATLVYVHAAALAWYRRQRCSAAALGGFAGIVCLGCGCVFSLTIASICDFRQWPEEMAIVLWNVVLPLVAWCSCLGGCFLLLCSATARRPDEPLPAPAGVEPPPTCGPLAPLVLLSLAAVAVATAVAAWYAFEPLASVFGRRSGDRSVDLVAVWLYGLSYQGVSLLVLGAAWVCGRRAVGRRDPELLWRAGALAVAGGLQHPLLLGLPAVAGGLWALRAANRNAPRALLSLLAAIRRSWGGANAAAFVLLLSMLLWELSRHGEGPNRRIAIVAGLGAGILAAAGLALRRSMRRRGEECSA